MPRKDDLAERFIHKLQEDFLAYQASNDHYATVMKREFGLDKNEISPNNNYNWRMVQLVRGLHILGLKTKDVPVIDNLVGTHTK
jgi:hypothetical protein